MNNSQLTPEYNDNMYNTTKIQYTNTAIIINDYDMGDCPSLEYNFKVYNPLTHSRMILGMCHDPKKKKLYLPRGIDLSYVVRKVQSSTKMMGQMIEPEYIPPHKYTNVDIKLKYAPRDDRQIEALRFMLCRAQYKANYSLSQFSVNLPTGAGKTYCSVATIAYLGITSIIITAQSGILRQWKDKILEYTNLTPMDIFQIEGSGSIDRILSGRSNNMNRKIYLITHATINSYCTEKGWDKIGLLFKKLNIGIKIYDEAHQNFANITMIDFFSNVYRTYYVTATPARSDDAENKIYSLFMRNIPSIDLFKQDDDPHTKYIAIRYNSNPRMIDIESCKSVYGLNRIKYIDYLMGNENFWMMFDYIFNLIEKCGGKALFYIGTNEAILKVRDHIVRHYPEYENDIGIYTSISEDKKEEREKRFILSTTKSAGAGEDIPDLKFSVVLAEPFKSDVLAQQTLGRTRDNDTFYIELVDTGFRQTANYYNHKRSVFRKYALSCKQIDVPKFQLKQIAQDAYKDRINRGQRIIELNVPRYVQAVTFTKSNKIDAVTFFDNEDRSDTE